jgi:hypothetical protein
MLGFGRVRFPYRRFPVAPHHTHVRYRPPLSLSLRSTRHMSTSSPIHPVETSQQRSGTALDKPHADIDITENGGTQKAKDKKLKEQPGSIYPLEVRLFNPSSFEPGLTPDDSRPSQLKPKPEYFDHRIQMFEHLKAEYDGWVKGKYTKVVRAIDLNPNACCSRPTATRDHHHSARWF